MGIHRDAEPSSATSMVAHCALYLCKDGVILTHAHVFARVNLGAQLAHEDISREHLLPGIFLDPTPLCIAVATVT